MTMTRIAATTMPTMDSHVGTLASVSYTHLDVYKRQSQKLARPHGETAALAAQKVQAAGYSPLKGNDGARVAGALHHRREQRREHHRQRHEESHVGGRCV